MQGGETKIRKQGISDDSRQKRHFQNQNYKKSFYQYHFIPLIFRNYQNNLYGLEITANVPECQERIKKE
jgi:hypothetical protein